MLGWPVKLHNQLPAIAGACTAALDTESGEMA
jgi:hypothetical protein